MLPFLTPDLKLSPSSINDFFNARETHISDVGITPEYIGYLRPINETEEKKYLKHYSNNETIIDTKIYEKRKDQYDYQIFNKLALQEKLI